MNVRPYITLHHRAKLHLLGKLQPLLQQWVRDWLGDDIDAAILKIDPLAQVNLTTHALQQSFQGEKNRWLTWIHGPQTVKELAAMIWWDKQITESKSKHKSPVVEQVVAEAVAELMSKLAAGKLTPGEIRKGQAFADDATMPGAGTVVLHISINTLTTDIVLGPSIVAQWLKDMPATAVKAALTHHARDAIADRCLDVRVHLGDTWITMGDLATLNKGDVIPLNQDIEQPSRIRFLQTAVGFYGYLGKHQGRLAVRIAPQKPAANNTQSK